MAYSDRQLAELSRDAYTVAPSFNLNENQAVITQQPHLGVDPEIAIAFRGTEPNIHDWLRDLSLVRGMPDLRLGLVHGGFRAGAQDLYRVAKPNLYSDNFVLTGHSLGGALALAFGALMLLDKLPPRRIVTFGAPRVGMLIFSRLLSEVKVVQYRNGNDPVCEVPPWPFQHVADLRLIGVPRFPPHACHPMEEYLSHLPLDPEPVPPPTTVITAEK